MSVFTEDQQALVDAGVREGARRACQQLIEMLQRRDRGVQVGQDRGNLKRPDYWRGYQAALQDAILKTRQAEESL